MTGLPPSRAARPISPASKCSATQARAIAAAAESGTMPAAASAAGEGRLDVEHGLQPRRIAGRVKQFVGREDGSEETA